MRIATRGSLQARTQAEAVASGLRTAHPGLETELVIVETTGDRRQDVALHQLGGQGVFVKEVQLAVLDGRADLAVHSAKDLPSAATGGLTVAAWCARRDPRDALVGRALDELPPGATVATGSVRRRFQLGLARPDLVVIELRGNIQTRLAKVPEGGAIVMAVAALEVLDLTDRVAEVLPVESMVPMVGQGTVAVECRDGDAEAIAAVRALDDAATRVAVETERAFLAELGAGCSMPVGALVDGTVLHTFLADPSTGRHVIGHHELRGVDPAEWRLAGAEAARRARRAVEG